MAWPGTSRRRNVPEAYNISNFSGESKAISISPVRKFLTVIESIITTPNLTLGSILSQKGNPVIGTSRESSTGSPLV